MILQNGLFNVSRQLSLFQSQFKQKSIVSPRSFGLWETPALKLDVIEMG
jgi:hypothetical protein